MIEVSICNVPSMGRIGPVQELFGLSCFIYIQKTEQKGAESTQIDMYKTIHYLVMTVGQKPPTPPSTKGL